MMKHRILAFTILLFGLMSIVNKSWGQSIVVTSGSLNLCPGASVTLKADNTFTNPTYQWQSTPDGGTTWSNIAGQINQNFITSDAGTFQVLINNNPFGPVTVVAVTNPTANFTFTQDNACSNVASAFTNSSNGTGLTYLWNFQDPNSGSNNTSTTTNPTHTFIGTNGNGNQTFTVSLTATNNFGCDNTTTRNVTKKQLPNVKLGGPSQTIYNGLTYFRQCSAAASALLNFVNQSTTATTNTSYKIIWGDATPDFTSPTFMSTTHTYNTGTYTLQFIIGGNGCSDTVSYNVFVGSNPAVGLGNPGNSTICTSTSLTFPITGASTNTPGTTYTVTFSDGTSPVTFSQPPPSDFTHAFNINSCGYTTQTTPVYTNSFSATIQASNPCLTSAASVVPIYVSQKPSAAFTISPKDTVCINTSVTLNNISSNNNYVNSPNCEAGNSVWSISPSTGYTILSGSIGNDFGVTDPSLWTNATSNLQIRFTTVGTYTIKLKVGNPNCGISEITKTICVNALPTSNFNLNQNIACAPFSVTVDNITNNPNCGVNTYAWSVSYASTIGCLPNTGSFSFIGGTNASSINPQIQFTNPGVYTIGLITTSPGGCISTSSTKTVTVKSKPTVSAITATNQICQNGTITPSVTVGNCNATSVATYAWSFPSGSPSTSSSANPGTITYSSAGTFTISLDVTNECGTTTVTKQVVVNETPNAIVPANKIICNGFASGAFTFSSAVVGASFNWTNNTTSIGLSANGSGNIGSFNGSNSTASPITATITVTPSLGTCAGTPQAFTITVNPTPALPSVTSTVTYCQNATANALTATALTGHTLLWYTTSTGGIGSTTAPTPSTTTATTTTYYVSQVNSTTNCESSRSAINVVVNASPVIGTSSSNNTTTCATATGSITLEGLLNSTTYSVSYVLNGNTITGNFTSNGTGTITINNLASGTYNTVTVTRNNCPSLPVGPFTISDPNPPATPSASANSPLCSGSTLLLSSSSLTAGVTYNWSGPNSFSSVSQNPQITNVSTLATGIYSVTSKLNGCTSPAATVNVTINQTPATPIVSSNTPICSGVDLNLTSNSSTAGVNYAWTGPNSFTNSTQNPTIATATIAASGTYNVTASNGTCISTAGSTIVTVKPTPNISGNSKIDPTQCASNTGSITLSGLTNGSSYTVNFVKGGVNQSSQTITAIGGNVVIPNLGAGVYTNITVTLNGCISNIVAGPITLSDPTPPATPVASSNSPICSGNTLTLGATSATAGVTFNWSGPASFNTTGATPTRTNTTVAMSGIYSVTATLNNCTSPAGTATVTINQTPVTPTITSNSPICSNQTLTLNSSTTTAGAITYAWTGPNSFNSTDQNPTIANATTAATGTYNVIATATTGNCASQAGTAAITVKPTPNISGNAKTDPTNCNTATGTITLSGLIPGTYTINYKKNSIAQTPINTTVTGSGEAVITALTAGTYSDISVVLDGCSSNVVAGPITLSDPTPPAAPIATTNAPICSGNTLTLSATSATSGVIFAWSGPNSFNQSGANPSITNVSALATGTYSVTATLNSCTSPAGTIAVTIYQSPAKPTITTNTPVCTGSTLSLNSTLTPAATVTYLWTGPNSFTSFAKDTTITNVITAASGQYSLIVTSVLGNCPSETATTNVVVNPTPTIGTTVTNHPLNCNTATGSIVIKGLTTGGSYTIKYNNSAGQQTINNVVAAGDSVKISNLTSGTYSNIFVILNNCPSASVGPFTLVDPNPPATPTASSNTPICSGNALNLTAATTTTGAIQYNWSGPNNFTSTSQNPTITAATTVASGTYSVTATLNSCVSAAGTVVVLVDSTPVAPIVSSNSPLCFGSNLNLTSTISFPSTLTYAWTGPNGFTASVQNPTILNATELASGTYSLTITANAGNCSPGAVTKDVIVRPLLTQASINGLDTVFVCNFNPPANASQSISANLNATRSFETGKWTIISQPLNGSGSFANDTQPSTSFTYAQSGLYQLQWAITNDVNCPSTKDTVFLSIVDQPQIKQELTATAINVCAGNPVTISVPANQVVGSIKKWQFKRPYTNTIWQDTVVTNPTITFNNVQDTFSIRLVVIATNQIHCSGDTAFKEIKINVAPPSLPGISTGEDTVCQGSNSGTIFLTGNIGSPTWQSSTNGINFTNISGSAVQNYTYTNLTVTTWFRAAVKSGVCDTVFSNTTKITVFPPVTIANAGADVELCGDSTYQLNANVPSSLETGVWSFASGSPTATINSPNAANTIISNMVPNTNYKLVWTLSNGICPPTTNEMEIKNYLPLTNTIDTLTKTVCNSVVISVTGNPPVGGNIPYLYQWQVLQGGTWVNIPGATNMDYTFTADTTVKIRRQVTAVPCSNFSLEKTIYVQPPLSNNTISGNVETCINTTPGVLTGSLPVGADGNYFYQWQILQGTTWTDIATATQKDYTVPILTVTTQFRRLVTSALCSGNQGIYSSPFEVIVRPDAKAVWTITKDTACAPFSINNIVVSPVHQALENGSYSWYANNIFYGNNATQNPGYVLSNPGDSVIIKMVAVSLYGCKNDSLQHKFFTLPPVLTNFTLSDSVGCGPLSVAITNTTPYLGFFNYAWNFGNQQTSNLQQPGTIIFQSNPNFTDTTYYITLTATSECEVVTKTKSVTVKAKPKSIFTPDKTIGCSPLPVSFTNISKGLGATYIWDFGDGTQQAIATPSTVNHTFVTGIQDTFKVKLISINQCGNDTAIYNIVVAPSTLKLDFAVNGTEKQGCKSHTVKFINASSGVSSFQWNFGDGNTLNTTKNIDTVNHTFLQSGTFNVTVFATNGCSDTTASETIQVFNPPSANFAAMPLQACIGDTIHFTNQSDTTTSLLWNFKDGYTSSVTNPVHAYTIAGVYNVQLKAIRQYNSGLACTDSIVRPITIVSKLPGYFSVTDSISNCVPFTVTFTNNTLPSSLTVWNFAPGINDTGNVVTHTFTQVGTYSVKMTAKHPTGCTYEGTKSIIVRAPSGTIAYDNGFICGNLPVRFEATVQNTDSIRWNFGDGTFLTTASPIIYHTYNQSGLYVPTATLTSTSLSTCSVLIRGIDTIKVDNLKAGFRYSTLQTCGNTKVQFTDTSRKYLPIVSWRWDFGDGTFSTLQNPVKNYTTTNSWQIQLIVTSASGCSDTLTKNIFIKVNTVPSANINAAATACTNRPVTYEAQYVSADTVSIINWSFSNGVVLTGSPVNNYYLNTGTYTATLIVGTLYGCQDTVTKTISINQSPTITASADATICKGQSKQLNVTGTTSYAWSPIDGSLNCISCTNPIAKPLTTTYYVVTGTNSFGCTAIDTVVITVAQPIDITVSPNDTICIGQSSQLSVTGATTYTWSPGLTLNNTTTAFPTATPTLTTRYRVIGFDSYNCFQDTAYVTVAVGQYPTVNLGADKVLATGTPLPLVTTITNGPITKWTWGPTAATLSCNDCPTPIATIKREICYAVEVANLYKCTARDTMCVKVFCENAQVFIPNAFTPDGDGVNDVLMVRAQGIRSVKNFRIFNRWGQLVFEKNNFNPNDVSAGWDGLINGKLASPDVYVYMCEVVCENDVIYTYKGNVSIVK